MQKITPFLWFDGKAEEDAAKSQRVMQAMMQMEKIDIAGLERAYEHA
jgi:predicted 3-demethylubiquinone-9 3-methyltransferase (glyoxalase superfamily)